MSRSRSRLGIAATAAVSLVAVPAAFAHGGDPTRIHACVIPPQNAVVIVYAPGLGGDPDFDCASQPTKPGVPHWKNLDWPSILSGGGGGGPTGPTGPRGPTGPTGPTGPDGSSRRRHGR